MSISAKQIEAALRSLGDQTIAAHSRRFFKTEKGEYGEGDVFLGIRVPVIRAEVKKFRPLALKTISSLLHSKYHETRLFALFALVDRYEKGDGPDRNRAFKLYLANTQYINNWDLVDLSAHKIVGAHLQDRSRKVLYRFARSSMLWERRISIIATFWFINRGDFADALRLAELLLDDEEDLMHKAAGWMLREVGKRDRAVAEQFLKKHCRRMPRTMLRYAIERFPERLRKKYLAGTV